jgi:hypothetical protein
LPYRSCVIDGEVVIVDEEGRAVFDRLQVGLRVKPDAILFAFDMIELEGADMRRMPLLTRKRTASSTMSIWMAMVRRSFAMPASSVASVSWARVRTRPIDPAGHATELSPRRQRQSRRALKCQIKHRPTNRMATIGRPKRRLGRSNMLARRKSLSIRKSL